MLVAAIALGYAVAVYLTTRLRFEGYRVAVVWPPGAILLCTLLALPLRRSLEAFAVAGLAFVVLVAPAVHYTPVTGTIFHVVIVAQIMLAAAVVRLLLRRPVSLQEPEALLLLGLALALVAVPSGLLRTSLIRLWQDLPVTDFDVGRTIAFGLAVTLGTLNLAPLLMSLADRDWRRRQWTSPVMRETFALAVVVVVLAMLPPIYLPVVESHWPVSMVLPIVPFLWASMRVGLPGVSACLSVYMLVVSWRASHGASPFAGESAEANVITLQLWMLTLSAPALAVASVLAGRERARAALLASRTRAEALAGRLLVAQDAERTRVAAELHDHLGQLVSSLAIGLARLRQKLARHPSTNVDAVAEMQTRARSLADELRRVSHGLHSGVLEHAGLVEALRALAEDVGRLGYAVRLDLPAFAPDLAKTHQLCLYRVAQEAIHNAVRHADMQALRVSLEVGRAEVRLTVADDGRGFDTVDGPARPGLGLAGMRERVRHAGGRLVLDAAPGRGTRVVATLPVDG